MSQIFLALHRRWINKSRKETNNAHSHQTQRLRIYQQRKRNADSNDRSLSHSQTQFTLMSNSPPKGDELEPPARPAPPSAPTAGGAAPRPLWGLQPPRSGTPGGSPLPCRPEGKGKGIFKPWGEAVGWVTLFVHPKGAKRRRSLWANVGLSTPLRPGARKPPRGRRTRAPNDHLHYIE